MDFLIKKNVIKKDKIIVDIGSRNIKILEVHYEYQKMIINNGYIIQMNEISNKHDYNDIAEMVAKEVGVRKNTEVSVSLPSELMQYKIVVFRNKKESEIPKLVGKEYDSFLRISRATHVFDYGYLGKRTDEGDTLQYVLITAAPKNTIDLLIKGFKNNKMSVTSVSFALNDIIQAAKLINNDEKSRLVCDFGAKSTRIVAFTAGVPVYLREINIGFHSFVNVLRNDNSEVNAEEIEKALIHNGLDKYPENLPCGVKQDEYYDSVKEIANKLISEIERVIESMKNDNIDVSEIICGGYLIPGLTEDILQRGINIGHMELEQMKDQELSNFTLYFEKANIDDKYMCAVGNALITML